MWPDCAVSFVFNTGESLRLIKQRWQFTAVELIFPMIIGLRSKRFREQRAKNGPHFSAICPSRKMGRRRLGDNAHKNLTYTSRSHKFVPVHFALRTGFALKFNIVIYQSEKPNKPLAETTPFWRGSWSVEILLGSAQAIAYAIFVNANVASLSFVRVGYRPVRIMLVKVKRQ